MGQQAHRRQGEEGDPDEGEGGGQQASVPGDRTLVPVTDGRQGDLTQHTLDIVHV